MRGHSGGLPDSHWTVISIVTVLCIVALFTGGAAAQTNYNGLIDEGDEV
jgi:hypothetical protein